MSLDAEHARREAARLLDEPGATGAHVAADDARAIAWALKDIAYDAWSSEPPRAVAVADALRVLADARGAAGEAGEIEALARWTEGIACVIRGQIAESVACFDRAAELLRAAGLADPAAQTQVPKIMALSMLGRHRDAAACAAVAQRELLALGNVRVAARVSQNLGGLQFMRDDYIDAARHYREAAVLFARVGDFVSSVRADIGLADALTAMGDFDEALRIFARARMRAGTRGMALQLAQLDESVALLDQSRGRYPEALAGFESARRRYESLGVPQYLAVAERQLADAYLELRLLPEARALLDSAVRQFAALAMPDEQAWSLLQRGRAETLLDTGDADATFAASEALFASQGNAVGRASVVLARAELALAHADASAARAGAARAEDAFAAAMQASGRWRAAVVRARALLALGDVEEARDLFSRGLQRARAAQQRSLEVQCLTGLGLVAQAAGDAPAAARSFDAAIALFEEQRAALPGDDLRTAFLGDHLRPYQERLRAAVESGDGAAVLWQLDRFRARSLELACSGGRQNGADASSQALRERLDWLYRRVRSLENEGGDASALDDEVRGAEEALLESSRRARLGSPAGDLLGMGADAGFTVAALQAALRPGDALVAYGVVGDELFACVATDAEVTLVRQVAAWSEVRTAIRSMRFQIETLGHGSAPVQRHLDMLVARAGQRLASLHEHAWAPLAGRLGEIRRVAIVPHGTLGLVPFAALHDGIGALGERHELCLVPSARLALRGLRRGSGAARHVVAFAAAARLPHTAREATEVAARFESGTAFIGADATLAALRASAPSADVLHLACHARFRSDSPRFSALHLDDEVLTADEVERLGLGPCTVVMSACDTALAADDAGDERIGLVRAFFVAGAARVVASLWPVDDGVTAGFMSSFHGALAAGENPAAALARAQRDTRLLHPHPAHWAAFALYGGW